MNIMKRVMGFVGLVRPQAVTHRSIRFRSLRDRMMTTGGLRLRLTPPTVILFTLCASFAHAAPITVKDDAGHTLVLKAPAQRVLSLAPSLTEMLFEYSDFPPPALKVPRIGSNQKLDLERIATLKPDLVLVWFHGNAQREVERLRALNIPMAYFEPHGIADIPGVLERIGQLMGSERVASAAATRFKARHATLQKENAGRTPIRVFYQIAPASPTGLNSAR
jgi:iron complex transport system substrate-binding protein